MGCASSEAGRDPGLKRPDRPRLLLLTSETLTGYFYFEGLYDILSKIDPVQKSLDDNTVNPFFCIFLQEFIPKNNI